MILLRVFFDFGVEVLESFEAWFLQSFCTSRSSLSSLNALRMLLFIGVWGWVSDTSRSLIGDTCHSLISPPMSSLTCARPPMSSLTCARLLVSSLTHIEMLVSLLTCAKVLVSSLTRAEMLVSSLTHAEVWLVLVWHLVNFCWFLSSDSKT